MTPAARIGLTILALFYLAAAGAPFWAPHGPDDQFRDAAWSSPSARFPLGSDGLGRDQLSRLLFAARASLLSSTAAALIAVLLGGFAGTLAAQAGGWLDSLLMRLADLSLALPWTYTLLAVRAALPLDLPTASTSFAIMLVLGLAGWARPARIARAVVSNAHSAAYVLASRSFGACRFYLLRNHLLPEARSALAVHFVLVLPHFLMAEATLSFLGLGFSDALPSWGNLFAAFLRLHVMTSHWWMALPIVIYVLLLSCYHALGRGWAVQAGPDLR